MPVVNLGLRFGLSRIENSERARIVVVEGDGHIMGLVVDEVSEVLRIQEDQIDPAPDMISTGIGHEFVEGIGKSNDHLILLLAPDKLLTVEEKAQLAEIAHGSEVGPQPAEDE